MQKKSYLISIYCIILILLISCRKKELDDVLQFRDHIPIEHCFNSVIDTNEQGLDCGEECGPCIQSYAPCVLKEDTICFINSSFIRPITQKTYSNYEYVFDFEDGGFITLKFNHQPNLTTDYSADLFTSEDVLSIDFLPSQWDSQRRGFGKVYVNYENGHYSISACNINIPNSTATSSINISFKLLLN